MSVMQWMLISIAADLLEGIGPLGVFFSPLFFVGFQIVDKTADLFLLILREKVGKNVR